MKSIINTETVRLDDENSAIIIIDQTLLPAKTELLSLKTQEQIWDAIYMLRVRGAPAIGVSAAFGLYLKAKELGRGDKSGSCFIDELRAARDYLASARPTAVNLFWALDRMMKCALNTVGAGVEKTVAALKAEAVMIADEDERVCRAIGEYGLTLIKDGDGILTHCNAGQLAATKYGTALAPIHLGREKGMNFRVYADETRPLLQGARLTAYECVADGVDTTLICDNMASSVMKNGFVDAVFVGCDRVAANGDTANKIGTSGVAILAKYYGIPFYVCAPLSTVDMTLSDGSEIPVEERKPEEVTELWYEKRMAPEGIKVYNPAFDVTDSSLITAFVTEKGIIYPPFRENLCILFADR